MKMNEVELYNLEKELIKKHEDIWGNVRLRPIKIIKKCDYGGLASKNFLKISKSHIDTSDYKEIENTLAHEINHYALEGQGHSDKFLKNMTKIGYPLTNYEVISNSNEGEMWCMKEEIPIGDHESKMKSHKRPQWRLFEENAIQRGVHAGKFLKRMRKRVMMDIPQLAKATKLNVKEIKVLESAKNYYQQDDFSDNSLKLEKHMKTVFRCLAEQF